MGLGLAREAYRAGRAPFLTVLETQRTLLAARADYIEARQRSALALAELEKVTGRPMDRILAEDDPIETTPGETGAQTQLGELEEDKSAMPEEQS